MRSDFYFESHGGGQIRSAVWMPSGEPKAVMQILHGIAEHIERYENFARYLNQQGIIVVAADHMGHGKSIGADGIQGYFHGGWFAAVEDAYYLLRQTKNQYSQLPYILFGHSMGSFMARTILSRYPDSGISGAIICGTGWQSNALLQAAIPLCRAVCKKDGEKNPSALLQKIIFGGYNNKVEHVRTANDWLTRDSNIVDAYNADPLCGFAASAGLYLDMLTGIRYVQQQEALKSMDSSLPVLFIAGGEDPVGGYGKGVLQTVKAFEKVGMADISSKLYPLCRHEILNEINKDEVFRDISKWIDKKIL